MHHLWLNLQFILNAHILVNSPGCLSSVDGWRFDRGRGDQARWSPGVSEFSEGKMQGVPGVSRSSHITLTHQNHSMHHNTHTHTHAGGDAFTHKHTVLCHPPPSLNIFLLRVE